MLTRTASGAPRALSDFGIRRRGTVAVVLEARNQGRVRRPQHRARWARCSREAGRSSVGNELPVPPHQRCGRNEEGGPTLARKKSRERRQHDTIGGGEARSRHLTTEHRELVTKDRDLDVLLIWRRSDPNEVEQLSTEKEGHRTAHADDPGTFAASLVRAAFLRLHPTGVPTTARAISPLTPTDDDRGERRTYANNCSWRTSGSSSGTDSPVCSWYQAANMRRWHLRPGYVRSSYHARASRSLLAC